jgi:hypothetical protein
MRLLRLLYTARLRIRSLLRRALVEQDLDDEFRDHLERRIEADVARGVTADEARSAALRTFGGVEQRKEECRDMRGTQSLDQFRQDISYACRMLRRTPGFAAIAIASLGIGIGANAVLFSLVDGLMLRPLHVPRPEEVVAVRELWPGSRPRLEVPYWEYLALRDGSAATLSLAAFNVFDRSVDNSRARIGIVSGNYFSTLQVGAAVGRVLTTDDDVTPLAHPVAVISDDYWTRQLRRLPDVLGQTVVINGTPFVVVGVVPRGFTGEWVGRPVDIWVTTMISRRRCARRCAPSIPRWRC